MLWERLAEELWAMKLGLRLLQERANIGSFWWPYISNLPETYSVPIFFQGEDIKNLQYAPLLYQVFFFSLISNVAIRYNYLSCCRTAKARLLVMVLMTGILEKTG